MALPIFPTGLPGLAWDVLRSPMWSTRVQTSRSGKEYRAANWSYGKYKYELNYTVLRAATAYEELQTIIGFFNTQQGMFAPFLYDDPSDDSITLQALGTGNGTQTAFPFVRSFGGFIEPVLAVNTVSQITVNGTPTAAYTLSQSGSYGIDTLNLNVAPTSGQLVKGTFTYWWPCRFLADDFEFNNFALKLWGLKSITFQTVK